MLPPSFIFVYQHIKNAIFWFHRAYLKIVSCCQMIHQVRVKNWDHESCSHKQIEHDVPLSKSSPLTFKIENNFFGISEFIKNKYEFNYLIYKTSHHIPDYHNTPLLQAEVERDKNGEFQKEIKMILKNGIKNRDTFIIWIGKWRWLSKCQINWLTWFQQDHWPAVW